jgi:hypothetical protein
VSLGSHLHGAIRAAEDLRGMCLQQVQSKGGGASLELQLIAPKADPRTTAKLSLTFHPIIEEHDEDISGTSTNHCAVMSVVIKISNQKGANNGTQLTNILGDKSLPLASHAQ